MFAIDVSFPFDVSSLPFRFAHATCRTIKTMALTMSLYVFTNDEICLGMISMIVLRILVLALIVDDFWHRYRLHVRTALLLFLYFSAIEFTLIVGIVFS